MKTFKGAMEKEFEDAAQAVEGWPEWKKVLLRRAELAKALFDNDHSESELSEELDAHTPDNSSTRAEDM
jgi:hypothetical protein